MDNEILQNEINSEDVNLVEFNEKIKQYSNTNPGDSILFNDSDSDSDIDSKKSDNLPLDIEKKETNKLSDIINKIKNKRENFDIFLEEDNENKLLELIKEKDGKQMLLLVISYLFEFYKSIVGSLLTLLIPQSCDGKMCTVKENLNRDNFLDYFTLSFNFVTLFSFFILYLIEFKREILLIMNLKTNKCKAKDNFSVQHNFTNLEIEIKDSILNINKYYSKLFYFSFFCFLSNLILSAIYIHKNYLEMQTIIVFISCVLFLATKLYNIFIVINNETFMIYSSYLSKKIQFNDVNPIDSLNSNSFCESIEIKA